MSAEKGKKIYQVAKELNVASPAIVEYLEDKGFDVNKKPKHMTPLSDAMYEEVIKKFDPSRWQKQLDDEARAMDDARKAESEKARTDQLSQLLDHSASGHALDSARSLINQVEAEEAERDRVRREEEDREKAKADAERKLAEDAERARLEAADKVKKEREAQELKRRKEADAKRPPRSETAPRREGQAGPPREQRRQPGESRPQGQGAPRPQGQGAPRPQGTVGPRPASMPLGPASDMAKAAGTATGDASKDKPKRRPTRADLERIEKQKKLIAAQKTEKYRPSLADEVRPHRRRKVRKRTVDKAAVDANIKQTLASMDTGKRKVRHRDKVSGEMIEQVEDILKLTEFVNTQELANLMEVDVSEVIKKFLSMGKLVTINQRLDKDTIELIADEFGFAVEFVSEEEESEEEVVEVESADVMVPRPPVVTVMGHVDHGKTSLLDYLRKTSVIASEHGGITQHIGAYEVMHNGRLITFLDTPGHEAFTAMRARGAQVTDIVILVVSADDQVRPQTVEAMSHAQSAGVPLVVAINKMDRPNADAEKIRKQLADHNVLVEQWGGKTQSAEISAKTGKGMDQLLEEVLLTADILELKANPNRRARATVIETRLEKGRGVVATVIVNSGTLKVGDYFVAGQQYGKVRTLMNEYNESIESVTPGCPAQVVGFSGAPQAGDTFVAFESEKEVKDIAMRRQLLQREQTFKQIRMLSLDQISQQIKEGGVKDLQLIIKGDADGSVEAICDTLQRLSTKEVAVKIIHRGVGTISESDVLLAAATGSIILGFHVHPNLKARDLAMRESVDIRVYRIIYEMENDVREALEGLLEPDTREDVIGLIEVRQIFRVPSAGTVAGSYVVSGKIARSSLVRLIRDGRMVWRGKISSLKRFKNDASEVKSGFECGISLEGMNDIHEGDTMEVIEVIQIKRKLESSTAWKCCVALLTVEIFIPESHSLKDRRNVMNSIKDRIKNRFNVSVCENDVGEKWQLGGLMISCVAETQGIIEKVFSDLLEMLDSDPRYSASQPKIVYYA